MGDHRRAGRLSLLLFARLLPHAVHRYLATGFDAPAARQRSDSPIAMGRPAWHAVLEIHPYQSALLEIAQVALRRRPAQSRVSATPAAVTGAADPRTAASTFAMVGCSGADLAAADRV